MDFRDFKSDFKVPKSSFRNFWWDFTDDRVTTDCRDFRLDCRDFRSDFRTFAHQISEVVGPSVFPSLLSAGSTIIAL